MKRNFDNGIFLSRKCPFCGQYHDVLVDEIDYIAYLSGELIQNAFPYLTADEREIIQTGICSKCWEGMFA